MSLTLYIANKNYSSWSLRPWLLLRELGVPFTEVLLPFGDEAAWAPFRTSFPAGKVPALQDGALRVWDSFAIVEHVHERFGGAWPDDAEARAWARSAAAEMHSGFATLRGQCGMNLGIRVALHELGPALRRDLARVDTLWCEGLSRFGGPLLAGARFSAVDAFFAPVAFRVLTYGLPLSAPAAAYAARLRERPAMQEWYTAALAEPWRDAEHDAENRASGTWTADLRARG